MNVITFARIEDYRLPLVKRLKLRSVVIVEPIDIRQLLLNKDSIEGVFIYR